MKNYYKVVNQEQEKLKKLKALQLDLVGKFEDVTVRLNELGTGGDAEKWVAQLRELRSRLDAARSQHEKSDDAIARVVAEQGLELL